MAVSTLTTIALGPFSGAVDSLNPSNPQPGKLRNARNLVLSGLGKLSVRPGTLTALTLQDDAAHAAVTSVLHVGAFADGAVAVAHSTVTNKVYLYRLPATMDGWYDATGALQSTLTPQPCAVLWTAVTVPPDVWIAEGLGVLYAATTSAIDATGLYFRTQQVSFSSAGVPTVQDLPANGSGGSVGPDFAYFTVVCAFHQHLWGFGYGSGNTPGYTSFRPELGKFSQPSFGALQTADSIVIGDKVRALRERPVGAWVAGNAMFVAASKYLFRITGYGRQSWFVETLDQKYGVVGPKAAVAVGDTLYYWSSRGPMRCQAQSTPQPLWDAVVGVVASVANEAKIVAGFDASLDQVQFLYDNGSGVRALCAFDTRRDDYASLDGDIGLVMNCAGVVEPIYKSTVTPPAPPAVPVISATTVLSDTSAYFTWTESDAAAGQEVSLRVQGAPVWSVLATTAAGILSYTATGLTLGTAYEWRIRALRSGVYSAYVGPIAASQFTTTGGGPGPAAPTGLSASQFGGAATAALAWTNADATLQTQVLRSSDGVSFTQVGTAAAGATAYNDAIGAYGTFYYEVRHVTGAGVMGAVSAYASVNIVAAGGGF